MPRETKKFFSLSLRGGFHDVFIHVHIEIAHSDEGHFFIEASRAVVLFRRFVQEHNEVVVIFILNGIDLGRLLFLLFLLT